MGYRPKSKLYRLSFEDPDFEGLEVTMKSLSIEGLTKMTGLVDALQGDKPDLSQVDQFFRRFARSLVSWNVEDDDGQPVPATYEGLGDQDVDFLMSVAKAWMEAITTVAPPLSDASSSGESPEASLNLASASSSLPS